MNKLFIVLLALCLVNVHAFVKRDTEPSKNDEMLKSTKEFFDSVGKKISETFSPDNIKKEFNSLVDNVNKAIDSVKSKPEEPKQ